jgi:Protein of unknown function (DUF3747)
MKPSSVVHTTALLWSVGLALSGAVQSAATAATFEQQELDQGRVIAVAVPLAQGDRYNLLILEQLSTAKQCWQQNPSNPNIVDPLLLKFDFTNICGRSTDSNGYSVRIAGQDKALDYRLSIAKQNNHLVLLAVPSRNAQGSALAIARTESLEPGFLKLQLNPEWRFTKRSYSGKTLGHIYLTRDTEGGSSYIASAAPLGTSARGAQSSLFRGGMPGRSPVAPRYGRTVNPITAPIQIPVPSAPSAAVRLRRPVLSSSSPVFPVAPPSAGYSLPTVAAGVLPVPTSTIPLGTAGNEPDLITANTPSLNINAMAPGSYGLGGGVSAPFQVAMANPKYRVFVKAANGNQRQTVKTLVPDSFRSSYQGQPMLQVGAFQDRAKADEVIDLLNRNGISSILAAE